MAYTRVWTIDAPPIGAASNTLGVQIRNLRQDLQERINTLLGRPQASTLPDPLVQLYDAGNGGATINIDWENGPIQKITLNAASCAITFSNPIAGRVYALIIEQDGVGGRLFSLAGWNYGVTTPSYNSTASSKTVVSALYDGTEYLAALSNTGS